MATLNRHWVQRQRSVRMKSEDLNRHAFRALARQRGLSQYRYLLLCLLQTAPLPVRRQAASSLTQHRFGECHCLPQGTMVSARLG